MENTTGSKIKRVRNDKGMTQRELSEKSEVSINSIQKYESDARTPKIEALSKIAAALDVPVNELTESKITPIQKAIKEEVKHLDLQQFAVEDEGIEEAYINDSLFLLEYFDSLNEAGKICATELVRTLTEQSIFKNSDSEGNE